MPVYQLVHSGIPLGLAERDRLAKGILAIHHSETNAPEPFVRVVFEPLPLGTIYTAGRISPSVLLSCGLRAGRSQEIRQRIVRRCYDLLREVTQAPPDEIFVIVQEEQSSWIMEAGLFLPEPNDDAEAAWLAELQETYPGTYDGWGTDRSRPGDQDEAPHGVTERAADLRRLAEEMLAQTRREGADVRQLLGPLRGLLSEHLPPAGRAASATDGSDSRQPARHAAGRPA